MEYRHLTEEDFKKIIVNNIDELQIKANKAVCADSNDWLYVKTDINNNMCDIASVKADVCSITDGIDTITNQLEELRNELYEKEANIRATLDEYIASQEKKVNSKIFDPISEDVNFPIKFEELVFDYNAFIEKLYNL